MSQKQFRVFYGSQCRYT